MRRVVAAVLAGGEGTRFRPYTEIIPCRVVTVIDAKNAKRLISRGVASGRRIHAW